MLMFKESPPDPDAASCSRPAPSEKAKNTVDARPLRPARSRAQQLPSLAAARQVLGRRCRLLHSIAIAVRSARRI